MILGGWRAQAVGKNPAYILRRGITAGAARPAPRPAATPAGITPAAGGGGGGDAEAAVRAWQPLRRVNHAPQWSRLGDGDILFLSRGQPSLAIRATELRGNGWGREEEAASTLAGRWVLCGADGDDGENLDSSWANEQTLLQEIEAAEVTAEVEAVAEAEEYLQRLEEASEREYTILQQLEESEWQAREDQIRQEQERIVAAEETVRFSPFLAPFMF